MQRKQGGSRAALVVCLAVLVFLSVCTSASAIWTDYIISEDVLYWVLDSQMQVYTTADWNRIPSSDVPLIKVQQTVYNQDFTAVLKDQQVIPDDVTGYLYAYSVSNLNVIHKTADPLNQGQFIYSGIKEFKVNWSVAPITVTTSMQTPQQWDPFYFASGPKWMWRGAGPGLMPGETVGGFWAFSDIGTDARTTAYIKAGDGSILFSGETTGPLVPEPTGLFAVASGIIGLFGWTARTRRK